MRIYFDVCCLNRPLDDPSRERVRLEAAAVVRIFGMIEKGVCELVSSDTLHEEIAENRNPDDRAIVLGMLTRAVAHVSTGKSETDRARELRGLGFATLDATHIACAESIAADAFLTTDDPLIRCARRYHEQLDVRVLNPPQWLIEVES